MDLLVQPSKPSNQAKVKDDDIDLIDWYVIRYNIVIKIDSIVII